MIQSSYGISKNLGHVDFDHAVDRVISALKTQGFGIITEIDVKETMKKKLDVEFRKYKILGACNPPLAHQALENELLIGLLLPCNVIVFQEDDGQITASCIDPKEMFKVVTNPSLADLAEKVDAKLRNAIAAF